MRVASERGLIGERSEQIETMRCVRRLRFQTALRAVYTRRVGHGSRTTVEKPVEPLQLYNVTCRGAVAIADPTIAHIAIRSTLSPLSLVGLIHSGTVVRMTTASSRHMHSCASKPTHCCDHRESCRESCREKTKVCWVDPLYITHQDQLYMVHA